ILGRADAIVVVRRQRDGGQDGDDRDHDHEFDQGEALLVLHGVSPRVGWCDPRAAVPAVTVLRQPCGFGTCGSYNAECVPTPDRPGWADILKSGSRFGAMYGCRNMTFCVRLRPDCPDHVLAIVSDAKFGWPALSGGRLAGDFANRHPRLREGCDGDVATGDVQAGAKARHVAD